MIKKLIIASSLVILCHTAFAETCPTVKDIKNNALIGWKAYDSDDGTPLSSAREASFKKDIEEFTLAEWANDKNKNNTVHCYYRDKSGSHLEAYFAKDNFKPKVAANSFWYKVSGFMHCAAEMEKCQFESHALTNTQLAKK